MYQKKVGVSKKYEAVAAVTRWYEEGEDNQYGNADSFEKNKGIIFVRNLLFTWLKSPKKNYGRIRRFSSGTFES